MVGYCNKLECWETIKKDIYCEKCLDKFECKLNRHNFHIIAETIVGSMSPGFIFRLKYTNETECATAIFKDSRTSTHHRMAALSFIDDKYSNDALQEFNRVTNSSFKQWRNIPLKLCEDPNMVRILENVTIDNTISLNQEEFSLEQIVRFNVNFCIDYYKLRFQGAKGVRNLRYLLQSVPTLDEVKALDLSPELFEQVCDLVFY